MCWFRWGEGSANALSNSMSWWCWMPRHPFLSSCSDTNTNGMLMDSHWGHWTRQLMFRKHMAPVIEKYREILVAWKKWLQLSPYRLCFYHNVHIPNSAVLKSRQRSRSGTLKSKTFRCRVLAVATCTGWCCQAEFTDLVGENSPFLSALLKVYKKKVSCSATFRIVRYPLCPGAWFRRRAWECWQVQCLWFEMVMRQFSMASFSRWRDQSERREEKRKTLTKMRRTRTMRLWMLQKLQTGSNGWFRDILSVCSYGTRHGKATATLLGSRDGHLRAAISRVTRMRIWRMTTQVHHRLWEPAGSNGINKLFAWFCRGPWRFQAAYSLWKEIGRYWYSARSPLQVDVYLFMSI